ncbi:hypothetical protein K457DRAFT_22777 [Linnemannia elongata AG-77]|uniref:Uncharacterized protein n=1 Tax=Linnemannia elongata AG-77 TaxID=1314771 RepID=A0A197JMM0_9FUNG|nr:hypothetical protein K457DRAFT_22777 [Linnemannia elongata AG-77]
MCASFLRQLVRPGLLRAQPIRPTPSFPLQALARPSPAIPTLTFHRTLRTSATRKGRTPRYYHACKCNGGCSEDSFSTIWMTTTVTFVLMYLVGSGSLENFLKRTTIENSIILTNEETGVKITSEENGVKIAALKD